MTVWSLCGLFCTVWKVLLGGRCNCVEVVSWLCGYFHLGGIYDCVDYVVTVWLG